MGKPAGGQQYREDPDAVSLHTTSGDYEYDDAPDLPSYDDSEAAAAGDANAMAAVVPSTQLPGQDTYAVIPQSDSNGLRQSGKLVAKHTTSIRMDERLNDPEQLHDYITNYLRLVPPEPAISPSPGAEDEGWRPRVAANSDKVHRGSWRKMRAEGYKQDIEVGATPSPDLMHWCRDFSDSKSSLKIFRIAREVPGLDTEYLNASLTNLIRSTNYRGHIDVSFPIEDKHVDIYSPHIINRWRISWVRFIFYFTFLWLITWPILFFMTKRWSVYKVDWCFSWQAPDGRGGLRKRYARTSEQAWLESRSNLVRGLAIDKYQGDATHLPIDASFNSQQRRGSARVETGNANVDAAVGFIQQGMGLWNSIQRGRGRDVDGWGGDER